MKTILSFILLFVSLHTFSQTKKLEVTNNQTGKSILFQEAQRVKVTTVKREKLVGILTFESAESIAVNGVPVSIDNINSIKYFPKKGRTLKKYYFRNRTGISSRIWRCSRFRKRKCLFIICRRSWNNSCWRTHWQWQQNLY